MKLALDRALLGAAAAARSRTQGDSPSRVLGACRPLPETVNGIVLMMPEFVAYDNQSHAF